MRIEITTWKLFFLAASFNIYETAAFGWHLDGPGSQAERVCDVVSQYLFFLTMLAMLVEAFKEIKALFFTKKTVDK